MIVECGSCGARNEFRLEDRLKASRCERCRGELPPLDEPLKSNGPELVDLAALTRVPVLAVFAGARDSSAVKTELKNVAARFAGKAVILLLDAEDNLDLLNNLGMQSVPSFALVRTGRLLHAHQGWVAPSEVSRWLKASAYA